MNIQAVHCARAARGGRADCVPAEQEQAAAGCVVLGDPAYCGRFGFRVVPGLVYPGAPTEFFMAQVFAGVPPQGEVAYHAAFASEV